MNKFRQLRFQLLVLSAIAICIVGIVYIRKPQVNLTAGACPEKTPEISQTITRESDQTSWCLSGLPEQTIHWQWSPDEDHFAYALQDKSHPTRQLSGRMGYIKVDNLNWYVMNSDGSRHRRFSAPDPFWFTFSPDGQYAVYSTYNDYGQSKFEVVKIRSNSLVCRYERFNLWYHEGQPTCNSVELENGGIWDIETEINRDACEFHVTTWKWADWLEDHGCRELLQGTGLVPTPMPSPNPGAYPVLPANDKSASPYP